eukprot:1159332-Pelagomonas_calceolata.AAC.7
MGTGAHRAGEWMCRDCTCFFLPLSWSHLSGGMTSKCGWNCSTRRKQACSLACWDCQWEFTGMLGLPVGVHWHAGTPAAKQPSSHVCRLWHSSLDCAGTASGAGSELMHGRMAVNERAGAACACFFAGSQAGQPCLCKRNKFHEIQGCHDYKGGPANWCRKFLLHGCCIFLFPRITRASLQIGAADWCGQAAQLRRNLPGDKLPFISRQGTSSCSEEALRVVPASSKASVHCCAPPHLQNVSSTSAKADPKPAPRLGRDPLVA